MKSRALLAFALVISLTVVPSIQLALAATSTTSTTTTTTTASTGTPFSHRLDVYVAGTSDFWMATISPVNATKPGVLAAESVPGVTAYELSALKTSSATAETQLFWGSGYDLLHYPFIPNSGIFLNVTATSEAAASQAAAGFNQYVGSSFELIGTSGQNYTFFSTGDFTLAGEIIYSTTVPSAEKGLASISSAFSLAADPTPTVILTGVKSGSSFVHTVSFGSMQKSAVASNSSLTLGKALNIANDSILAAASPGSTTVAIHLLDGLISTKDAATVSNDVQSFSSSYVFNVPAGTRFRPNVTVLQDPPVLTATRLVSPGSQVQNGLLSVTILLRNTGETGTISNISMNDSWWTSFPSLFTLSAGTSTVSVPSLAAGQNASQVYVLRVTSAASQTFVVPSAPVTYSYSAGGAGNVTVSDKTTTNQVEVRVNDPGPALSIIAGGDVSSGAAFGTSSHYVVTVKNSGDAPALSLRVDNFTVETLVQGSTWTFNTSLPLTNLVNRNFTRTFAVSYLAPDGTQGTLTSNLDEVVLSHAGVLLPLTTLDYASSLSPSVLARGTANATYTLTNSGTAAADTVTVSQPFVSGVTCTVVVKGNATCGSSSLSISTSSLGVGSNVIGQVTMAFGSDNYMNFPATVTTTYHGLTLGTRGGGYVLPAGVTVQRADSPNPLFQGQNDTVKLSIVNNGARPVYNMSVSTQPDGFDQAVSGALFKLYPVVNASSALGFNYTVNVVTPGNHTTAAIALSYAFAGFVASYNVYPNNVEVYHAVQATTTVKPSIPVEGHEFSLGVSVVNPSAANVTDIALSIPLPPGVVTANSSSGMELRGHTLYVDIPSLEAGATSTHFIALKSAADGTFAFGTGSLTFHFLGDTIKGIVSSPAIVVGADLLLRYELPIAGAVVITVLVAFYMRRKLSSPEPK